MLALFSLSEEKSNRQYRWLRSSGIIEEQTHSSGTFSFIHFFFHSFNIYLVYTNKRQRQLVKYTGEVWTELAVIVKNLWLYNKRKRRRRAKGGNCKGFGELSRKAKVSPRGEESGGPEGWSRGLFPFSLLFFREENWRRVNHGNVMRMCLWEIEMQCLWTFCWFGGGKRIVNMHGRQIPHTIKYLVRMTARAWEKSHSVYLQWSCLPLGERLSIYSRQLLPVSLALRQIQRWIVCILPGTSSCWAIIRLFCPKRGGAVPLPPLGAQKEVALPSGQSSSKARFGLCYAIAYPVP